MVSLPTPDEWEIAELAALARQAAGEDAAVSPFITRLAASVAAEIALVAVHDFRDGKGAILYPHPPLSGLLAGYLIHAPQNPWLKVPTHEPGAVWRGEEIVDGAALADSAFYRDWLGQTGLRHWLAGIVAVEGSSVTYVAAFRGMAAGPFSRRDVQRLRRLLPHLRHSLCKTAGLESDGFDGNALLMLEHTSFGVLSFDRAGKVRYASAKATLILNRQDGLALRNGVLVAESGSDTLRIADLVATTLGNGNGNGHANRRAGGAIAIRRRSDEMPYFLRVFPCIYPSSPERAASVGAIGILQDPMDRVALDRELLASLYDLTPAETRVAELLSQGFSPAAVAADLGITINTVRTHLKRIFEKTGIGRQSELVRLLVACFAVSSTVLGETDRVVVTPRQTELRFIRQQGS